MSLECVIRPFKNQVWDQLRHEHNSDNLFEDPEFPCTDNSMFFSQTVPSGVEWKRPKDAMDNPQFFVDNFDRGDLDQGYLGNCWFIAGAVGILQSDKCFAKVVPREQGFDADYGGIFHFRFWQYGEWVDVVIDDRLPFYSNGKLVFCSNKQHPNELWGPLLEKAYAKLYGSYESLDGGFTTDALIDMSGGLAESFDLTKMEYNDKKTLWNVLHQAYNKGSIIGCSINADPSVREARMSNGLVRGHAYTVTKVVKISVNGSDEELLRCRNPWGNEVEWNGEWSDRSSKWNSISDGERQDLGLVTAADGEFWMEFDDFIRNWNTVQICHLSVDCFRDELLESDNDNNIKWKCSTYHGAWQNGLSAGGCGQPNQAKFWTNPQFLVRLTDVDADDNENMSTLIVALMQKDTRLRRHDNYNESSEEYIQFRLFKIHDDVQLDENKYTGLKLYANQLDRIGTSGSYINTREVTKRFRVPPGNYLIIPSTYEENKECEFMVRLYTEQLVENTPLEVDKDDLNEDDVHIDVDTDMDKLFDQWNSLIGSGKGKKLFDKADKYFGGHLSRVNNHVNNFNMKYGSFIGTVGKHVKQFHKNGGTKNVQDQCSQM